VSNLILVSFFKKSFFLGGQSSFLEGEGAFGQGAQNHQDLRQSAKHSGL